VMKFAKLLASVRELRDILEFRWTKRSYHMPEDPGGGPRHRDGGRDALIDKCSQKFLANRGVVAFGFSALIRISVIWVVLGHATLFREFPVCHCHRRSPAKS
jgi:hypothetical protein